MSLRSRITKAAANSENISENLSQLSTSSVPPKRAAKSRKQVVIETSEEAGNSSQELQNKLVSMHPGDGEGVSQLSWKPPNWPDALDNIRIMRAKRDAPVDLMGCEKHGDFEGSEKDRRFHVLVSLMLSSQTRDQVTDAAMKKLKSEIPGGLSVQSLIGLEDETLGKLIYPVGFWKKKIQYLKKTAEVLRDRYDSDIPPNVEGLCKLPGVGPKMAHICMDVAWGNLTGIGVDTHVHRIANRLGWTPKVTKAPEETRRALEDWMPRDQWREMNLLLVGFGQQICLPIGPKCRDCLNLNICPFAKGEVKIESPRKRKKALE